MFRSAPGKCPNLAVLAKSICFFILVNWIGPCRILKEFLPQTKVEPTKPLSLFFLWVSVSFPTQVSKEDIKDKELLLLSSFSTQRFLLAPQYSWIHVWALLAGCEIVYTCVEVDGDSGGGKGGKILKSPWVPACDGAEYVTKTFPVLYLSSFKLIDLVFKSSEAEILLPLSREMSGLFCEILTPVLGVTPIYFEPIWLAFLPIWLFVRVSFLLSPETTGMCHVITFITSKFILNSYYTMTNNSIIILIYSFNCA